MAGPIRAWGALGGAMNLRLETRWWSWLLIILLIYVTVKSPSTSELMFSGLVHGFADVGNAIVRIVADLHSSAH
jgi:hypothetical protein